MDDIQKYWVWCEYYARQTMAGARVTVPESLRPCVNLAIERLREEARVAGEEARAAENKARAAEIKAKAKAKATVVARPAKKAQTKQKNNGGPNRVTRAWIAANTAARLARADRTAARRAEKAAREAECRRRALAVMYDPHPNWARSRVPKKLKDCVTNHLADLHKACADLAKAIANGATNATVPANLRPCVNLAVQKRRAGVNARGKPRWIGPLNFRA